VAEQERQTHRTGKEQVKASMTADRPADTVTDADGQSTGISGAGGGVIPRTNGLGAVLAC
jgi:hypothetical protein